MPKERFYLEQPLLKNETLTIKEKEFHHLINVMRVKVGEEIEIVNGEGFLAKASLEALGKREALLRIEEVFQEKESDHKFRVILAQGIPRKNKLDEILEKATELGATEIWLFPADKSEIRDLKENQLERAKSILISAMKQSGRLFMPKLILKPALKKFTKLEMAAFFGEVKEEAPPFLNLWKRQERALGVIFFIGPESGFSEDEILILRHLGVKGVKLNANILRTETAAIVALALISSHQLID